MKTFFIGRQKKKNRFWEINLHHLRICRVELLANEVFLRVIFGVGLIFCENLMENCFRCEYEHVGWPLVGKSSYMQKMELFDSLSRSEWTETTTLRMYSYSYTYSFAGRWPRKKVPIKIFEWKGWWPSSEAPTKSAPTCALSNVNLPIHGVHCTRSYASVWYVCVRVIVCVRAYVCTLDMLYGRVRGLFTLFFFFAFFFRLPSTTRYAAVLFFFFFFFYRIVSASPLAIVYCTSKSVAFDVAFPELVRTKKLR